MLNVFIVLSLLFSASTFALEIDEKLTLRIVNTSASKKTILINRGLEDGLAKGDHAKFFVSVGVVARGVAIKVSPTRSVWSVYRLVNKEYLRDEQVLKLKITPAVKITKDESQMLVRDDMGSSLSKDPRDIGIPLAEGADDLNALNDNKVEANTEWVNEENISMINRNKELFGMIHYSSMTEESTGSSNNASYAQEINDMMFRIGGEWYFDTEEKWYTRFSFLVHFALEKKSIMSYDGNTIIEDASEFGFGSSVYLFSRPSKIHTLIPYLNYTLSLGSTNSRYISGDGITETDKALDASILANTFAFGLKYYTTQGLGFRIQMDYKFKGETYAADADTVSWTRTSIGPKVNFGISYRF